nr:hypothetical protein [Burkholderia sp. Ac-20392]
MVVRAITVLVAGWSISVPIFGAVDLIPKEIEVRDEAVSAQIVNNGDHAEFVSISLAHLLNPGVPLADEKIESVGDMAEPALYVYPFRMSIAPGQRKTITLKPLKSVDSEVVYRLDVKPVMKMLGQTRRDVKGNVAVNLAFSGLVRQLPAEERAALLVTCDSTGARVTSTGNIRYNVKGATIDGQMMDDFNVYPGVSRPLTGRVVTIPGQPTCHGTATE